MKISRVLFLLLFPLIAEIFVACCDCNIVTKTEYYVTKALTISLLDNSGKEPTEATHTTINKKAFGLRLKTERIISVKTSVPKTLFISAANAFSCECPPPYVIQPRDSVVSINIITMNNFDASHSANSDISNYFKVYELHNFSTINTFIKYQQNELYDKEQLNLSLDLLLITPPSLSTPHVFKVIVSLSDGRMMEAQTPAINLL